jgi:hypothetical protein
MMVKIAVSASDQEVKEEDGVWMLPTQVKLIDFRGTREETALIFIVLICYYSGILSSNIKMNIRTTAKTFARKTLKGYCCRVPTKPPKKTTTTNEADEGLEKIGLYLSSKVAHALRIAAATHRMRISAMAEKLIEEGLARLEGEK